MYSMKLILEPDVIDLLNRDRFEGDLEGYILSDGADLFGWSLFKIEDGITHMLDIQAPGTQFVDGLIRASVAYGENGGAKAFTLNPDIPDLKKYRDVFFRNEEDPIATEKLFVPCEDE